METKPLSLWNAISSALSLDSLVFTELLTAPNGIRIALITVLLAGFSEAFGQSVVLFINRVMPGRFWLALIISTISHMAGYLLWSAVVWLAGSYLFDRVVPFGAVASVVGLAYAPRIFAFFTLIPFLGNTMSLLMSLWSMLAVVVALEVGLQLELWQAIVTGGAGWFLVQVWQRTLGRPVYAIDRWVKNFAAGVPLIFTMDDINRIRRPEPKLLTQWKERLAPNSPSLQIPTQSLSAISKKQLDGVIK